MTAVSQTGVIGPLEFAGTCGEYRNGTYSFRIALIRWRLTPTTGDTVMSRPVRTFRILAINDTRDDFHAVWTIEREYPAIRAAQKRL